MKSSLAFIFALLLPLSAVAQEKIKIGASIPLSGEAATYGVDIKNGLQFSNKHLADNKYELIIEDDQCSDKQAVTAAQKLVNIDKVKYVLGFGCSGSLLAAAPVYDRAKVIAIGSATGAPAISQAGDYIFRTIPSLNIAAKRLYEHAAEHFKTIGIVTEETDYCQGLTEAFKEANSDSKLLLFNENFLPQVRDFKTVFLKLKTRGVNALFLNPQSEAGLVTMYKQVLALDWKVPVLAAYYPASPAFLSEFGALADGIVFSDLPFNTQLLNEHGLEVYEQFEKEYGPVKSGEFNVTLTYAAFSALHQAIESGQDVKSYLYKNAFRGIIDSYSFDKNGDVVSDKITFVLKTIRGGKPVPYINAR